MTQISKTCPKCGDAKPATAEYWHRNAQSADGLHGHCRACRLAHSRAKTLQRQPTLKSARRHLPATGPKTCPSCKQTKPRTLDCWSKDSGRRDGLDAYCRTCRRAYQRSRKRDRAAYFRDYARRYPEKVAAKSAMRNARRRAATPAWVDACPVARAWIEDFYLLRDDMNEMMRLTGHDKLEVDHVIPLARGGTHEPGNLALLNKRHNLAKSARLDWRQPKNCFESVEFHAPQGVFVFDIGWNLVEHIKHNR